MPRNDLPVVFTDVGFPASVRRFRTTAGRSTEIDDHHRVREDLRTYEE
jgi:hypothetical protein